MNFSRVSDTLNQLPTKGKKWVLYQKPEPNKTNYLRFFGKAFRNAQLRYTMPRKEQFAIIYGLQTNHYLCYGRHVNVLTDSAVLTYYHSVQADSRILNNWYDILSQYSISITHIPGESNILPDAISRFNLYSRQEKSIPSVMPLSASTDDWQLNPKNI